MIEVKIDPVKMIEGFKKEEAKQQAQPPPQPQQEAAPVQQQEQPTEMEKVNQLPLNPLVETGINSYQQVKSSWDKLFGFLQ